MRQIRQLLGAIAFYTTIPIPPHWPLEFLGIARWAPLIGLGIGGWLALLDWALGFLGMPFLPRSALIVGGWVAITGGLHFDGAMDTADGLAVLDPQRRLDVMADSRSGAFGVMAAGLILMLKITALASLGDWRWLGLLGAAGWGRWGQLVAIACYPYLKPEGKGAFHKQAIRSVWEVVPGWGFLVGLSVLMAIAVPGLWPRAALLSLGGTAIALLTGRWLYGKLGGHTGDTYGAVVEWTEALLLCVLTIAI